MSERKQISLDLDGDLRKRIVEGAECVAVEFHESATSAHGVVVAAGSRQECKDALPPRIGIVPDGLSVHTEVWDASVLGIEHLSGETPAETVED